MIIINFCYLLSACYFIIVLTLIEGENFSVVDCYFFALVRFLTATWLDESIFNVPVDLSSFSNIEKWYNLVKVRPAVQQAVLYEREAKKKEVF